jgi:hypothetical protein
MLPLASTALASLLPWRFGRIALSLDAKCKGFSRIAPERDTGCKSLFGLLPRETLNEKVSLGLKVVDDLLGSYFFRVSVGLSYDRR